MLPVCHAPEGLQSEGGPLPARAPGGAEFSEALGGFWPVPAFSPRDNAPQARVSRIVITFKP